MIPRSAGRASVVIRDPQTATVISVAGRLRHPRFARARANSMARPFRADSYGVVTKLLVGAILVTGCAGTPAVPSVSPSVAQVTASPTPVATPEPTASPTLSPSEAAATHITASVTDLMNTVGNPDIATWIDAESKWLDTQPQLAIIRDYQFAIIGALLDLAYQDDSTDLSITALKIIAAARHVPGVILP